jgi:hypothetical protein
MMRFDTPTPLDQDNGKRQAAQVQYVETGLIYELTRFQARVPQEIQAQLLMNYNIALPREIMLLKDKAVKERHVSWEGGQKNGEMGANEELVKQNIIMRAQVLQAQELIQALQSAQPSQSQSTTSAAQVTTRGRLQPFPKASPSAARASIALSSQIHFHCADPPEQSASHVGGT